MGTTVVGMLPTVEPGRMVLFNVGDSRVYRFRDAELSQLTRDHTLYQEWLDGGGQGDNPPRNVITRAIGPKARVENDVGLQLLVPGDLVLVCSDGLTGMVADPEISETLVRLDQATPDDICRALVDFANERGGKDNITVIVGRYS
jgi:protein phosphatase